LPVSQQPPQPAHLPVGYLVTVWAFQAALFGGLFAAGTCALLGGVAIRATRLPGEAAGSIAAIAATVLAGVVFPLLLSGSLRPWLRTAALVATGAVAVVLIDRSIPGRFDWPTYRWALGGTACGLPLWTYVWTLEFVREGRIDVTQKTFLFVAPALLLAALVERVHQGRAGTVLGGLLAGGCGGAVSVAVVGLVGWAEATEWAGTFLVFPLSGVALGAIGGGLAGWTSWRLATAAGNPAEQG
jgi:hypothetical protein